ncbi:MAG: hypothetical protein K9J27_01555 [Bacteroidales bacterium]|nr:hypothetical protein [Bacteroidales bacterium]
MSNPDLGNIQIVEPHELWKDEARDFTPWLAENAGQLSEAIGIRIEIDGNWQKKLFAWLNKHLMIIRKLAREVLG